LRQEQALSRSRQIGSDGRPNLSAKATPKSQRTRARILDAAMRLFAQIGYHAATNAVIADAAGLTRGAMLYHFATREELVEAAIAHIELHRARLFEQAASAPAARRWTPPSTPSTSTGRCLHEPRSWPSPSWRPRPAPIPC
jgi:AcrR family transcriptional regulator